VYPLSRFLDFQIKSTGRRHLHDSHPSPIQRFWRFSGPEGSLETKRSINLQLTIIRFLLLFNFLIVECTLESVILHACFVYIFKYVQIRAARKELEKIAEHEIWTKNIFVKYPNLYFLNGSDA